MKRILPAALLALTAVACSGSSEDNKGQSGKSEGLTVRLGSISAAAPKGWKAEEPANAMRAYQFRVPGAGGEDDAVVIVFRGIAGSAEANISRWKGQFTPPEGKKEEDVASVRDIKIGGRPASILDVSGTYLDTGMMQPGAAQVKRPDYRMLGVYIGGSDRPYQILLRGPAKTVAQVKTEFDDWLKSFQ